MMRGSSQRLVAAILATWALQVRPSCRAQELPPMPVPIATPAPASESTQPGAALAPPTYAPSLPAPIATGGPTIPSLPPPPLLHSATLEDRNNHSLVGDPLLDHPGQPAGFFSSFEAALLKPHITGHLAGDVLFPSIAGFAPFTDTVDLEAGRLDWTGSPRVEIGYRFGQGFGQVSAAYRSIISEGTDVINNFDILGGAVQRSRLNLNSIDLDYGTTDIGLDHYLPENGPPTWGVRWWGGARLGSVWFDSQAQGSVLYQRVSNNIFGAGPHAGFESWIVPCGGLAGVPGLGLFTRAEGAAVIGGNRFTRQEQFVAGFPGLPPFQVTGSFTDTSIQAVPVLSVDAGFSWDPPYTHHPLHFTLGYHFEGWWYLASTDTVDARLLLQGVFVRCQMGF